MDLPAHATKKSFLAFAGISAAALLGLLIPLYVTGGALPRPIDRSSSSESTAIKVTEAATQAVVEPEKPPEPPVLEAVYTIDVFDPKRDAEADLAMTVERATAEDKRILLQIGGDWCVWTRSMDVFIAENEAVATALGRNFLIMKVNYSDANDNYEFLEKFIEIDALPHYLILDSTGNLIHSQRTEDFEKGNSYDEDALVALFTEWATREPDPPAPEPETTDATETDPSKDETADKPETKEASHSAAEEPPTKEEAEATSRAKSGSKSKAKTKAKGNAGPKSKDESSSDSAP